MMMGEYKRYIHVPNKTVMEIVRPITGTIIQFMMKMEINCGMETFVIGIVIEFHVYNLGVLTITSLLMNPKLPAL